MARFKIISETDYTFTICLSQVGVLFKKKIKHLICKYSKIMIECSKISRLQTVNFKFLN